MRKAVSTRDKRESYFVCQSPIGDICCVFEGSSLTGIFVGGRPPELTAKEGRHSGFEGELNAYFSGTLRVFAQEAKFTKGTPFERTVWHALGDIPYGEVRSYRWLAERIGSPYASRAVGRALGRNPLPLVVPCHRVIASDGSLGGFSCGVESKRWLLAHEALSSSR